MLRKKDFRFLTPCNIRKVFLLERICAKTPLGCLSCIHDVYNFVEDTTKNAELFKLLVFTAYLTILHTAHQSFLVHTRNSDKSVLLCNWVIIWGHSSIKEASIFVGKGCQQCGQEEGCLAPTKYL